MIKGYDRWKTQDPREDYDDNVCGQCGMDLNKVRHNDYTFEGFCCKECHVDNVVGRDNLQVCRPMLTELGQDLGEDPSKWDRALYKSTACGAWLRIDGPMTISVGSIVEGSDAETKTYTMAWPFRLSRFWEIVQQVEDEVTEILAECEC